MKKTIFIKNAVILTATSLLLRFIGIIFKVWLAALIGSEGIGLHQLIFSVYLLVSTFASSGISTAVTRLTAEELVVGSKNGTKKILKRSVEITMIIAIISAAAVFFGAELIAEYLLEDARAIYALKILPLSLPFMGISACIRGYFIARRNVTPNAIAQIAEQGIRIVTVFLLVKAFINKGLALCCAAVIAGDIISEALGCLIIFISYVKDRKKITDSSQKETSHSPIIRKILHIAVPITSGRYLNTLLRTAENILVPKNLNRYILTKGKALSQFGMIKGMALPILFFPSALLNSISTLLIPEISEATAKNQMALVKSATQNILKLTAVISFIFSAIFLIAGDKIGNLFYNEEDIGFLLKALSPIVPFMYLDSISDGILKGLDQQSFTFRTAISDSVIRIILILIILPLCGINGFIGIMYFSNLFTCCLNVGRLLKVSKARIKPFSEVLFPIIFAFGSTFTANTLINFAGIKSDLLFTILLCVISLALYIGSLFISGTVKREQLNNLLP